MPSKTDIYFAHGNIKKHHQQFIEDVNRKFKPSNWKWVVVFELQKNGNWHWHLFSTPFVPYSHKCILNQKKKKSLSCWECRTYVNSLWPHGRVESRNLDAKGATRYLTKYIVKSFHLRKLYQAHGFQEKDRIFHFFHNSYQWEEREVIFIGKYRIDAKTGKKLNNNQHIFRRYNYETNQTTYFYRTNRKLVGKRVHPIRTKKHYRIGRNINPHPLLEQVQNHPTKPVLELKSNQKIYTQDFKQLVYSKLSALAETIRIVKIPLPKKYVPKEDNKCIRDVHHHFGFKIITYLTFPPENIPKAKEFLDQLDEHANEYGVPESKDWFDPRFTDPIKSRNAYLNNWKWAISDYQPHPKQPITELWMRTPMTPI